MRYRFFPGIFLLLLITGTKNVTGQETLEVTQPGKRYVINSNKIAVLKDPADTLTINDVTQPPLKNRFSSQNVQGNTIRGFERNTTYWLRIRLKNNSPIKKNWVFEIPDFKTDRADVYFPSQSGYFVHKTAGDALPFRNREYFHKNLVFDIPWFPDKSKYIYWKIYATEYVSIHPVLSTTSSFLNYAFKEYAFLTLFYGIVLCMFIYNLILLTQLKEATYFYYLIFVIGIVLFCLARDGLGFQFLWPEMPSFNQIIFPVAVTIMACGAVFYTREFLEIKQKAPLLDKLLLGFVIIRIAWLFISSRFFPQLFYNYHLDYIMLIIFPFIAVFFWRKGNQSARYYIIGFGFFCLGLIITVLMQLGFIKYNTVFFYTFNMAIMLDVIFLSFALAYRQKKIMEEKQLAQQETIVYLKEKNKIREQQNSILDDKINEWDNFIYKASHDIQGPLKSLLGLSNVAQKEIENPTAREYFQKIRHTALRMDRTLKDLITIARIHNLQLIPEQVDIKKQFDEVREELGTIPIEIKETIHQQYKFYSEPRLLEIIFRNITENARQFRDREKTSTWLHFHVEVLETGARIIFEDNGIGINESQKYKIFDMFYKGTEQYSQTGLGLYIVKIALEKINGSIQVASTPGSGSTFSMYIPNLANL